MPAFEPAASSRASTTTRPGIAELAAFCRQHRGRLVAMEATGGYERRAVPVVVGGGPCPARMTNPRSVRRYAEAMGVLEKTDRIDAGSSPALPWPRSCSRRRRRAPAQQRLKALVARLGR